MCDHHAPQLTVEERQAQAEVDAAAARQQGHDRLADTILRDAGLDPEGR